MRVRSQVASHALSHQRFPMPPFNSRKQKNPHKLGPDCSVLLFLTKGLWDSCSLSAAQISRRLTSLNSSVLRNSWVGSLFSELKSRKCRAAPCPLTAFQLDVQYPILHYSMDVLPVESPVFGDLLGILPMDFLAGGSYMFSGMWSQTEQEVLFVFSSLPDSSHNSGIIAFSSHS